MKKALLVSLSFVLVAAMAIGMTVAYLTDTDSDVNVMTMGNVSIAQHEYERVVENDAWVSTGETDKYGYTPDKLQEFTQAKPLLPAVFADGVYKWDDRANGTHQQSWAQVGAPGSNLLFDDSVKNVQDKFVFVENTGKTEAYVRTWFAFEQGDVADVDFDKVIMTNFNGNQWGWDWFWGVEIDGNTYVVACATYLGPKSNPTGILAPDSTTYASLMQVYMTPEATNEDVEAIDGNKNGTYDILVLSQAVQVAGFENAEKALDTAFGDITADNHPWADGVKIPSVVSSVADLKNALTNGAENILLAEDLDVSGEDLQKMDASIFATAQSVFSVTGDKNVTIDLNGNTITADTTGGSNVWTVFYAGGGANLTIENGTILYNSKGRAGGTSAVTSFGAESVITLNNVYVEQIGEGSVTQMIYAHGAVQDLGKIYVTGGTYVQKMPTSATNPFYEQGAINTNIIVSGGTFKVYHDVDLTKYMTLADGYKLELVKTDADGADWYTVVAE